MKTQGDFVTVAVCLFILGLWLLSKIDLIR